MRGSHHASKVLVKLALPARWLLLAVGLVALGCTSGKEAPPRTPATRDAAIDRALDVDGPPPSGPDAMPDVPADGPTPDVPQEDMRQPPMPFVDMRVDLSADLIHPDLPPDIRPILQPA